MGLNSQHERKLSELMRATVAEPQVRGREAQDERSGMQTYDRRNTNWQRGRVRAASVLANAKPKAHQDASSRARRHVGKVQALTRGDLPAERRGEVSRGRSSEEACRKALRGASFASKDELRKAIEAFLKAHNAAPRPFRWRKREVSGSQLRNTIVNLCN